MEKKKMTKMLAPIILMVIGGGVGFMAGKMGAKAAETVPTITAIWLAILFVPSFFLVIALHECGHAFAGIKMDFDFRMFVVGPFLWDKEQNGWKFKWNKNVNISGGMVICIPKGTINLSKRFSVYAAGGPLASLLLTGIAYGLHKFMVEQTATSFQITISYFFGLIAFLSLMIFFVTIIPIHVGGFSSDGARILRFIKGGEAAQFEILLIKIMGTSTSGTRPKEYDSTAVNNAIVMAKKLNAPLGVYVHAFAHQMAFDKGEMELAERHLVEYISQADEVPVGMRSAVWLDAAFFYAYAKRDIAKAIEYWQKFVPSAIIPKAQIYATEAAIAKLTGDHELMLVKAAASAKELPNMMDRGLAIALKEKLEILVREGI
jgi:TM2 domain-containing membrane protein YozV